jgi:8-amino-7-oxononanoate synthase
MLVLDDTQPLGIFGCCPGVPNPYGLGGGGSLRVHAVEAPRVVLVSSMAKGFGVPMAMVAGSARFVAQFKRQSATQVHSSPPSLADLHAAESALTLNHEQGDSIRWRLALTIERFRSRLRASGIRSGSSLFPVQSLTLLPQIDALRLYRRLCEARIVTVLHRPPCRPGPVVSLIITANHSLADIDRAATAIVSIVAEHKPGFEPRRAVG